MSAQKTYDFSCRGPIMPFRLHLKGIRITLPMRSDCAAADRRKCWDMRPRQREHNMNFLGEIAMPVKRWWRLLHETAKMRRSHCSFDIASV